uniref:PTTG1 interacting protein n=1 Tax=Rousettus aegyptiacus TaxID=9407 RepID=A0A7J8B7V3_ROUAE|nr:PTTG1 interacting protein [Rousettus aegyptiacus]
MGSGGARGPTMRKGLSLSGAALLLLLLPAATAQQSPGAACSQNTNRTCQECLRNVSCLWCNVNKTCVDYPVAKLLPPASLCPLSSARWGVCWGLFKEENPYARFENN